MAEIILTDANFADETSSGVTLVDLIAFKDEMIQIVGLFVRT